MIEKDSGFVLKKHDFRETSLIASIYTLHFGKITGIFKGFYTRKKEFSSPLDIFTLNEFVFYPKKREIWLVSFADLVRDYAYLRKDQWRAKTAGIFLRLLEAVMPLWDRNTSVFYLLREGLDYLEKEEAGRVLYVFLIKLLAFCGFRPQLNHCIVCKRQLGEDFFFSAARGGLLCGNCRGKVASFQKISKEASSSLLYIQDNPFPRALRIRPTLSCEGEILELLDKFCVFHLGFDIFYNRRKALV